VGFCGVLVGGGGGGGGVQSDDGRLDITCICTQKSPLFFALAHLGAVSKKCRASAVKHLF
jgi:hypothetical protein